MNFNTSKKRHQMISVEFDQNDSKELSQSMHSNEFESPHKRIKCDEIHKDASTESEVNENCRVEKNLNLEIIDSPPTPPLFESSQSQEADPTFLQKFTMDTDTQSACSLSFMENKANEKPMTSRKISLRNNFVFNPCDFVDDPEERKLPDLRSNRADPIGYVAPYPRKGEHLTDEYKTIYSERIKEEFDSIQEATYRQQRKSLTYMKWAPPIDIPLEDRVSSLSFTGKINTKRGFTVSNEMETLTSEIIDDNFEDEEGDGTFKGQAGQSQDSKASFTVQVGDDDDDEFLPYQNKRRGNRKKNRGGQQKNACKNPSIGNRLLSKQSNQDKKVDNDEDAYAFNIPDSNVNKDGNLSKMYSRGQVNRGESSLNRSTVHDHATASKESKSPISRANIKLQLCSSDDDEFQPVQNQKRKTGKKNQLPLKKPFQGKKVDILDYPDSNSDTYRSDFPALNSSTQKNLSKTFSKGPANSDEGSKNLHFGLSVERDIEINEIDDPVESFPCPMCDKFFSAKIIEEHASDCQGKSDIKCATVFKCDNEGILAYVEQNDERPGGITKTSKATVDSRMCNSSKEEVALSTSFPLKQLQIKVIDFRKAQTNICESPDKGNIQNKACRDRKF